jgi:TrpR-related protein YerC/YecD
MDWKSNISEQLVEAILALKTKDEARAFLRDLLTEGEIEEFSKRLETAVMLSKELPYADIQKKTGFSTTTIARVSKWLQKGKGGYTTIINRLHHTHTTTSHGSGLR